MLSLLAAGIAMDPPRPIGPPDADRSGEPVLRRLMEEAAKLHDVRIRIEFSGREPGQVPEYTLPWDLDLKTNKVWRFFVSDTWGGQNLYISDGKAFYHDSMNDSVPIDIKPFSKPAYEIDESLAPQGGGSSPLWYFLEGPGAFDKLVVKGTPVFNVEVEPYEGVRFNTEGFGTVTALYSPGATPELRGFSYDNLPFLKKMHTMDPEDFPEPRGNAIYFQMFSFQKLNEHKDMFTITVPPGRKVNDTRKKG